MKTKEMSYCARGDRYAAVSIATVLFLCAAPAGRAADQAPLQAELKRVIEAARDAVFPAVVNIDVVASHFWGGKENKIRSVGSGVIIDPSGLVVTNYHVTKQGKRFRCTLADRREVSAELAGEDPLTDVALLRLDAGGAPYPAARLGDSSTMTAGDFVMAMGSPLALSRSITLGIVSNTERTFTQFGGTETEEMQLDEGERTGLFTLWIQHDAMIMPGNSGGPLVNLNGEVIGINELGGFGAGFAIPSNLVRDVAAQLDEHGTVTRSTAGISIKPLQRTGMTAGVLINSVVENGPAARAGLQPGDRIVALDGEPVTVMFPEEVPRFLKRIADYPLGATLALKYLRGETQHETTLTTERFTPDKGDEGYFRQWGLTAEEITPLIAQTNLLDSTAGVLISGVRTGSPASEAKPPLREKDVITRVEGKEVEHLGTLRALFDEIMTREPTPKWVVIEFRRGGERMISALAPRPDDPMQPPRELPTAWAGIETQPVYPDLAKELGHPDETGFRVTRIYPRTTAAECGLQVGDLIVGLNGSELRARNPQDAGLFRQRIRQLSIGSEGVFRYLRAGEIGEATMVFERSRITAAEAARARDRDFEVEVREITFFDRADKEWDDAKQGVIVQFVESAGWAGLAGMQAGDLLLRIGDRAVSNVREFKIVMEQLRDERPERVVFLVERGVQTRLLYAEPEWTGSGG